jgi:hypothetical protein
MNSITKEILIEELIEKIPASVEYLMNKGIVCLKCGEPVWGTLESVATAKGFNELEIKNIVDELNSLLKN